MAWSNSKAFRQMLADVLGNTTAMDLDSDTIKAALYNNTTTPNQDVTAALSGYNAATSQWVVANEVSQAVQYPAGGVALASKVLDVATAGVCMFDAADTASGSSATLANVYGCLVYDDTLATPVAKQGICFNYFGGVQSVTSGTFTIQWSTNGIMRFTA